MGPSESRMQSRCVNPSQHNKHPVYHWSNGSPFLVGDVLFRVPTDELQRTSTVVNAVMTAPSDSVVDSLEWELGYGIDKISALSFERILKVLHPRWTKLANSPRLEFESFGYNEWVDVLSTADFLDMAFVREVAATNLDKFSDEPSISPIQKYKLGQQYPGLLEDWITLGLVELCMREDFLTEEEAEAFEKVEIVRYAVTRRELENKGLMKMWKDLEQPEARKVLEIVKGHFKIMPILRPG